MAELFLFKVNTMIAINSYFWASFRIGLIQLFAFNSSTVALYILQRLKLAISSITWFAIGDFENIAIKILHRQFYYYNKIWTFREQNLKKSKKMLYLGAI
jgi:hypothetical protein